MAATSLKLRGRVLPCLTCMIKVLRFSLFLKRPFGYLAVDSTPVRFLGYNKTLHPEKLH